MAGVRKEDVGGQAVIEGVMMRSPDSIATACRLPDGRIELRETPYRPVTKRFRPLRLPILRGAISFFEMLIIGMQTLQWSADIQIAYEQDQADKAKASSEKGISIVMLLTLVFALGLGVGLFFFLPLWITQMLTGLTGISRDALVFNLIAGAVRLTILLLYMYGISRFKDLRRVFEYHGAEHKAVFAYENGDELTVENARKYSTHHPRCGTSFVLIVVMVAILFFAIIDGTFAYLIRPYANAFERFGVHLLFLPFVAGLSFEVLKLTGRTRDNPITRILIMPGLWLQRITTIEPDDGQLEVAITALKASLHL